MQIGTENVDGILFGDVFYLNYHGINIFLYVCRTSYFQVAVYELGTKKIKYENKQVEIINNMKPARKPLIVTEDNCWTKSRFWVDTTKDHELIIPINSDTPAYKEAIKMGIEFPETGLFKAIWLETEQKEGLGRFYWDVAQNIFKKMS